MNYQYQWKIKDIFVSKEALEYQVTHDILKKLALPYKIENDNLNNKGTSLIDSNKGIASFDKNTLWLLVNKGASLKKCPGTPDHICCGYKIFHIGTNCPIDCSYCILQSYFNQPGLRIFVNIIEQLDEVAAHIRANPQNIFRVGTGEFTDSLALDHITGFSEIILPVFSTLPNAVLEFKTKTTNIEKVISLPFRDRVVLSWSLNSPYICATEEKGASSLIDRLKHARFCQDAGFITSFHFDPLIAHEKWEEHYQKTILLMGNYLDLNKIIWISLGSFRYMPPLKEIIKQRHAKSVLLRGGEFIKGIDGKSRYFRKIRENFYSTLNKMLCELNNNLGIYLCMETDLVWQRSLGWSPVNSAGLEKFLDDRAKLFWDIK